MSALSLTVMPEEKVQEWDDRMSHIEQLIADLKSPDADRLMTVKEVAEYTGFSTQWVTKYKEAIGYSQPPGGDIRFRKSKVDAYFAKHEILKKN